MVRGGGGGGGFGGLVVNDDDGGEILMAACEIELDDLIFEDSEELLWYVHGDSGASRRCEVDAIFMKRRARRETVCALCGCYLILSYLWSESLSSFFYHFFQAAQSEIPQLR